MTLSEELKQIRTTLKDFEKRISKLEGSKKDQPSVKKENKEGVYGYLLGMKDDNFFSTPKTLKEISGELARLGHYYKTTSLTNPLQRLIRQKKLGRIGKKGKWQYVGR